MKNIYFVILLAFFFVFNTSCKKDKIQKYFFGETWINENPVDFEYYLQGGSLGVGGSSFKQSIIELKFDGEEDGLGEYYGISGTGYTKHKYTTASSNDTIVVIDWGFWEYTKGVRAPREKEGNIVVNIPKELEENPETLGALWSSTMNGAFTFYFLEIKRNSIKVVFTARSVGSGSSAHYYSPIMTFKRKK